MASGVVVYRVGVGMGAWLGLSSSRPSRVPRPYDSCEPFQPTQLALRPVELPTLHLASSPDNYLQCLLLLLSVPDHTEGTNLVTSHLQHFHTVT